MRDILYGRNAVRECLRARRRQAHRLLLGNTVKSSAIIEEIISLARQLKAPLQRVPRQELDRLAQNHQGVALEVGSYITFQINDILRRAEKMGEPPFIVMLDHIEDPHNVGAILRTAEIVGVHGVIIPNQRAARITPAVVNASAGAAEHVWVAEVSNLGRAIQTLKERNIWVAGLEGLPEAVPVNQANLTGALALVIGSEGKGLRRLVRESCDFLVKLPMRGKIESLNASVAAGLIMYAVWQTRDYNGVQ
jgi:23S rRNA (guanosine2251-2'-O)-methyltransferase